MGHREHLERAAREATTAQTDLDKATERLRAATKRERRLEWWAAEPNWVVPATLSMVSWLGAVAAAVMGAWSAGGILLGAAVLSLSWYAVKAAGAAIAAHIPTVNTPTPRNVVASLSDDLNLLHSYDLREFLPAGGTEPVARLTLPDAEEIVARVAMEFPRGSVGAYRGDRFRDVVTQIRATAFGQPLYPTVESRTAALIYLMAKNHPLVDGNKRTAVALAAYYLAINGLPPMPRSTLALLALTAAASDPADKDATIGLLTAALTRPPSPATP